MGTYIITVKSAKPKVISEMQRFTREVREKGRGQVTGHYKMLAPDKIEISLTYSYLVFVVFKKVVFSELKKTVLRGDKNAEVKVKEQRKKKKTSLKKRIFGRFKKDKGTRAKA